VKTNPVADGGCARHLCLMLQRERGWMRRFCGCRAVQAEGREEMLIRRQALPRAGSRCILANL
jgi:hypothetical protein